MGEMPTGGAPVPWPDRPRGAGPEPYVPPPILVTVGDIACSATDVFTPNGTHPLARTTWIVTQQTTVSRRIPGYAIVCAILFFAVCFLGLLFLAIREEQMQGFMQVSVESVDGFHHRTQVPVSTRGQVVDTEQRVNYIRGLVAALSV